jgi:hypothetical protein
VGKHGKTSISGKTINPFCFETPDPARAIAFGFKSTTIRHSEEPRSGDEESQHTTARFLAPSRGSE